MTEIDRKRLDEAMGFSKIRKSFVIGLAFAAVIIALVSFSGWAFAETIKSIF